MSTLQLLLTVAGIIFILLGIIDGCAFAFDSDTGKAAHNKKRDRVVVLIMIGLFILIVNSGMSLMSTNAEKAVSLLKFLVAFGTAGTFAGLKWIK